MNKQYGIRLTDVLWAQIETRIEELGIDKPTYFKMLAVMDLNKNIKVMDKYLRRLNDATEECCDCYGTGKESIEPYNCCLRCGGYGETLITGEVIEIIMEIRKFHT